MHLPFSAVTVTQELDLQIIISLSTDNVLWSGVVSCRFGCGLGAQLVYKQMDTMII